MSSAEMADELTEMIRDTWGDMDDYEELGWNYVAFVILQDLREMEESGWDDETCYREMVDVVINSVRAIDELTPFDLHDAVEYRLDGHEEKGLDDLYRKYERLFEDRL